MKIVAPISLWLIPKNKSTLVRRFVSLSSGRQREMCSTLSINLKRHKRYFHNPFTDNDTANIASEISTEWLKSAAGRLVDSIISRKQHSDDLEGGVYTGIAGDGYGALVATTLFPSRQEELMNFCENCISRHIRHSKSSSARHESQFLLGMLGVYVVKILSAVKMNKEVDSTLNYIKDVCRVSLKDGYQGHGDDEMLVGRAGILAAFLNLRMMLPNFSEPQDLLRNIVQKMLESGRAYARRHRSPCPLMYQYYGTEYLGAAHGLMGILQMLLSYPHYLREPDLKDIRDTLEWILSIQQENGNIAPSADEVGSARGDDELVHWCHGATGLVFLMIVAYQSFKDDRYTEAAKRALELIWNRGLLHKGPGICHGVAGNGYAFLLFYRLTHEQEYLDRALCFAKVFCSPSFKDQARTPDSPYSLFEGISGSLCYLCDLTCPDKAQFPLVPIAFD
ncbi:hypothetical protein AB6A40_002526 [Gnathostoma spinigerum]|uniref:LanC-like protein 3 n=1 Tax=Gnathostoma spinigerum TaxID=75299 RepID=A0ABD6EGY2_9BILA